jgi:hypothetical protein
VQHPLKLVGERGCGGGGLPILSARKPNPKRRCRRIGNLRESRRANGRFGDARGRVAVHWVFLAFIQLVLDSVLARMSLF